MTACPRCGFVDGSRRLSFCPRCILAGLEGDGDGDGGTGDATGSATSAASSPESWPDLGAERLTIERELGAGGMGRVFRARDERLGRSVAIKVLRAESAADADFRARFQREARTLARLEHPGIVAIHDFGTAPGGESYLVMQLVTGGSLAERGPLPPAEAVAIARQLCNALAYAHGRGVVHRDIKPENVLLDDDGRPKLSDFGIARLLDPPPDEQPLTRPSLVLGTPGYLAPEARAGAPADPRMDVYALGALLVYMITGRHPDAAATGPTGSSVPGAARGPGAALPTGASALAPVLARAMAIDPATRIATAEELGRALDAAAPRLKAAPRPAGELPPEERTWRGAVALLAAVATAVAIYAALVSLTPRAMPADDALPFTAFGNQPLPDGRVLNRARFETAPTLGAAVAMALALAAFGLLRRHWRLAGLDRPTPDQPVAESRRVLVMGSVLFGLLLLRELLSHLGFNAVVAYIPVIGGVLELVMLSRFWDAVLEARRTSRSLAHEPLLWAGLVLALIPPAYHMTLLARTLRVGP